MYTYTTGPALDANTRSEAVDTDGPGRGTKKFNHSCVLAYDRPGAGEELASYVDCGPGWEDMPGSGPG